MFLRLEGSILIELADLQRESDELLRMIDEYLRSQEKQTEPREYGPDSRIIDRAPPNLRRWADAVREARIAAVTAGALCVFKTL
jgi:hypothetical protein